MAELFQQIEQSVNPDLLDTLPVIGPIDVDLLPENLVRRLFEALRLEIRYDKTANRATCRITLFGSTMPAAQRAAHDAVVIPVQPAGERRGRAADIPSGSQNHTDGIKEIGCLPLLLFPSL